MDIVAHPLVAIILVYGDLGDDAYADGRADHLHRGLCPRQGLQDRRPHRQHVLPRDHRRRLPLPPSTKSASAGCSRRTSCWQLRTGRTERRPPSTAKAYEIVDHTHRRDRRRRRRRVAGHRRLLSDGLADRLHPGLPDPLIPWRRRAASPQRSATWARTTGAGTCTTRSRGRIGSAIRTRSSICAATPRPRSTNSAHWGVFASPHRGGQDLPAALRRHDDQLRQRHRATRTRRRRLHRPCDPAHPLRTGWLAIR